MLWGFHKNDLIRIQTLHFRCHCVIFLFFRMTSFWIVFHILKNEIETNCPWIFHPNYLLKGLFWCDSPKNKKKMFVRICNGFFQDVDSEFKMGGWHVMNWPLFFHSNSSNLKIRLVMNFRLYWSCFVLLPCCIMFTFLDKNWEKTPKCPHIDL